jgi:predicted DNA-binding helix-hairpin-helix protein
MALQIRVTPSNQEKLALLGGAAAFDLSCACGPSEPRTRGVDGRWIYPAALPSGQRVPMLKVLQQAGCERNCAYCAERCGGEGRDALSFSPDDLARIVVDLFAERRIFGLFLSSAIRKGAVATMDQMLATAEILRHRMRYRGYLHLKIVPGCRADQVERAMELATRVSVNLEAPTAARLAEIAPTKLLTEHILAPMRQVADAVAQGRFRHSGQTTQLVVGAGEETDLEIARAASWLYRKLHLARVYYSAFQPIPGTPLADRPPTAFLREHRLYQVDFLLRRYGFAIEEIIFDPQGRLPAEADPKTLWARAHPERFPLEVNTARIEDLVRVPGIGPTSARRLLALRRSGRLRDLEALRACGTSWRVAAPYLLLDGRSPRAPVQLPLFSEARQAAAQR